MMTALMVPSDEAPAMWTPFLVSVLSIMQVVGEKTPQGPREGLEAAFERASKESDLDEAGLILSSLLTDEAATRKAFSTSVALDERSVYILFGGNWGSRAKVTWKDETQRHRILVESISTKPVLIRSIIRADRYKTYARKRHPSGAATINSFPFFSYSPYADDLVEQYIETLRAETTHPAEALKSPYTKSVMVAADEMEVNLLLSWQKLCGVCDRLDLIDKTTTKNWRGRFPELEEWFHKNRPYMLWDDSKSCIRIDQEAKEQANATPRVSRSIPELKPPWLTGKR